MLEKLKDFLTGVTIVVWVVATFLLLGILLLIGGVLTTLFIPIGLVILGICIIYLLGHWVRIIRKKGKG